MSMSIGGDLRNINGASRWFVRGARAWITLRPGSRPHRLAQKIVLNAAAFVLARPLLAATARGLLRGFPFLMPARGKIRSALFSSAFRRGAGGQSHITERERFVQLRLRAALNRTAT
jgi:hypothetical protein